MNEVTEVDIPIFLHPHLFWIFKKKNSIQRHKLECELTAEYDGLRFANKQAFKVGHDCVVKRRTKWCRAIIKDIEKNKLSKDVLSYEVWLCDYGCLYLTDVVYEMKEKFRSIPVLVKQASLCDVVFIDESFSLEKSRIDKLKNENPNAGTTFTASQFLTDFTLFFVSKKESNGVDYGDILYKKNFKTSSLTRTLIEKNLMIEDEELFRKIEESRIYDKDFHVQALRHASKKYEEIKSEINFSDLMNGIFIRRSARGISLGGNFSESETDTSISSPRNFRQSDSESNLEKEDISPKCSKLTAFLNRRRKNLPKSSEKMSENSSDTERKLTKREMMIQKLLKNKSGSENKIESSDESFHSCENSEIFTKNKTDDEFSIFRKPNENRDAKILKSPNTIFIPCGSKFPSKNAKKSSSASSKSAAYYSDSSISVKSNDGNRKAFFKKMGRNNQIDSNYHKSDTEGKLKISETEWENWEKPLEIKGEGLKLIPKPRCNCRQCYHWSNSDDWRHGSENFDDECKIQNLKISKPQSLLLKKKREKDVKLISYSSNLKTKLEKRASYKLLVHGLVIPTPIERAAEAPFDPTIHRSLKNLGYSRVRKIQSFVWPALSRNMNVCYINRKKSGKTLAYLPVLCSFLLEKDERYGELKKGGPIITILCKNSTKCEEIYDLMNKLIMGCGMNRPKILLVSYPFQHVNMSSVDVLITIPPVLIELLKRNATNMKRLCHLVFEDVDQLMEKYPDEINATIGVVESMLQNRNVKLNVQLIMLAEHWTLKLENFTKKLRDIPLISIGDYLEAAIYGRIRIHLKLIESKLKEETVINLLKDKWKYFKSVIICSENEIEKIKTSLMLNSISYIVINNELSIEETNQQEINWELCHGDNCKVLICTDQFIQTNSTITTAALLIHYSLPENWSSLVKRFECFLDNCKCPLSSTDNKLVCESFILTDEICRNEIPRLLQLLKNYNINDDQLGYLVEQNRMEKEKLKVVSKIPFCESMKLFGYCRKENCSNRHIIDKELDSNEFYPKSGTVKFKIIELINVNQLKVNILEHRNIDGELTLFKSENQSNDDKLTKILEENRKFPESIVKKEFYAYWDDEEFDDVFRKCVVENIVGDLIEIQILENGKRKSVCKNKIFELPPTNDEIKCSVELVLANFKPPYKDDNFSSKSYSTLTRFVEDLKCGDNTFAANICLQFGNTFWVNNIKEEVKVFELNLMKSCLSMELIKQKLAERNDNHLKILYDLCEKGGILLPNYENLNKKVEKKVVEVSQVVPQWAFLEDQQTINKVIFSSAVSPEELYFRLEKFDKLLLHLENDIANYLKRYDKKQDLKLIPGNYYLARDEGSDKFDRVLIKRIEKELVLCFSVDYGCESVVPIDDIRYLPNYLITKLPFQAIQCRLYGIKGIDDEWPQEACDIFYDKFAVMPNTDTFRVLHSKVVFYEEGQFRNQSRFSVLLKDNLDGILINRLLIDCGWAESIPNSIIENFDVDSDNEGQLESDRDEDVEEIKDIIETTRMVASNNVHFKKNEKDKMEDDDSDLELFLGDDVEDEMEQLKNFMNALELMKKQKEESSRIIRNDLPAIEACAKVDYNTPDVFWSQTKKNVQLMIKIPNVETYRIDIRSSRILNFRTVANGKEYRLMIILYDIIEKNYTHVLGGLEVKINLTKKDEMEWPRLSKNQKRLRNVHYVLSNDEMEEKEKKLFLDLGDEFRDLNDDNDGEMFTVLSDMDSDMDIDLESDSS